MPAVRGRPDCDVAIRSKMCADLSGIALHASLSTSGGLGAGCRATPKAPSNTHRWSPAASRADGCHDARRGLSSCQGAAGRGGKLIIAERSRYGTFGHLCCPWRRSTRWSRETCVAPFATTGSRSKPMAHANLARSARWRGSMISDRNLSLQQAMQTTKA